MASPRPTTHLHGFAPAARLAPAEQALLESILIHRTWEVGQVLFSQGDVVDEMFLILKGTLEVTAKAESGDPVILDRIRAGELLGEMGVLDDAPRSATATALTPVEALCLPRQRYLTLARDGHSLAAWLLDVTAESLARRIARMIERVADARFDPGIMEQVPDDPKARAQHWWQTFLPKRRR